MDSIRYINTSMVIRFVKETEKEALKMKCKYSKLILFHIGLHNTMRGKYFVLEMIHSKFCKWYDEEDIFFQEFFWFKIFFICTSKHNNRKIKSLYSNPFFLLLASWENTNGRCWFFLACVRFNQAPIYLAAAKISFGHYFLLLVPNLD